MPASTVFDRLLSGEVVSRENPFSAAREPRSRDFFTMADDGVVRAWRRTVLALPGAIVAALIAGPIYRWAGLDHPAVPVIVGIATALPFVVVGFGLTTGIADFMWRRHLIRDAENLSRLEHGIDADLAQRNAREGTGHADS